MNIVIASDENYILPTKVMLTSFLMNNQKEHHIIYFMYSSVKKESVDGLRNLVEKYDAQFVPVPVLEDDFAGFECSGCFTIETYYRLMLPQILPETEERALWLDVDIVINGLLDEFYYQDFEGYNLVGCADVGDHRKRMASLGCEPTATYINAGVILYNLPAMRHYRLSDYYAYYCKYQKYIRWNDQDVINGLFTNRIKALDCVPYNVQIRNRFGGFWPVPKEAKIIHFITPEKPWKKYYFHPAGKIWDRYFTAASGYRFWSAKVYMIKGCINRTVECCLFPLRLWYGKMKQKYK